MKYILMIIVLSMALLSGCHSTKDVASIKHKTVIAKNEDSTEYQVIIIDPEFDFWYQTHFNAVLDYPNDYYRTENSLAVVRWNSYYSSGKFYRIIDSYIDYNNSIDYGIDVNRKLYWYFKFVQERYHLRLLK